MTKQTSDSTTESPNPGPEREERRRFLTNLTMGVGLVVSHVTAVGFAVRFIYPNQKSRSQRVFVGLRTEMPPGHARPFRTPQGKTINIVHGQRGFVALSDVCPHLGCRVHWDSADNMFVCPCHDGRFDAGGRPISGPPADEGTPLSRYDLVVEGDTVFIDIPMA